MPFQAYLIVCPLIMLAGFVDASAGGGGLISLPAYYLAGLSPVMAAGTNKLSACLGTIAAAGRYQKSHKINYPSALPAALTALPGSIIGTRLLLSMNPELIRYIVVAALPVVGFVIITKKDGLTANHRISGRMMTLFCALTGFVTGFYDGLIGPGTGTFLIIILTMLLGMEAVEASASAKVINLASNTASLITFAVSGNLILPLGLCAAAFGIAGNLLGSSVTIRKGSSFIRIMLLCVLTLLLAKMILDMIT